MAENVRFNWKPLAIEIPNQASIRANTTLQPPNLENLLGLSISAIRFAKIAKKEPLSYCAITLKDIEDALKKKEKTDLKDLLLDYYKEFLPVFSRELANKLPLHRPLIDYKIPLIKDKEGNEPRIP